MMANKSKFKVGVAALNGGRNLFNVGAMALALSALGTVSGHAQSFSDSFNYPVGPLAGNGGWTGTGNLVAGGYTYSDGTNSLATAGNVHVTDSGFYDHSSSNALTGFSADTTFWVSAIMGVGSSPDGNVNIGSPTGGAFSFQYYGDSNVAGQNDINFFDRQLGTGYSFANSTGATGFALFKLDYSQAGKLDIQGWLNPTLGASGPGAAQLDTGFQTVSTNYASFTPNSVNIYTGPGSINTDEIRVGTTFASVTPIATVPEPSTWALMFGGVLSLFGIKRLFGRRSDLV